MKHPHIITNNSVVAFIKGQRYTCPCESVRYKRVLAAINNNDDDAFKQAMTETEAQSLSQAVEAKGFTVVNGIVALDGVEIIGSLQEKLSRMIREDHNIDHFGAFIRNLRQNPSRSAVKELYDFLSYAELPITENGTLLAYKGVNNDYWSCKAGSTKLKKGKVDNTGRIFNGVGEEIECDRVEVDDDRRNECSNGLHVGSHNYAVKFGSRTVVVEVNPKDVVSVPLDCECQKMRVCGYKVISDYSHEIKSAVVDSKGEAVTTERQTLAKALDAKVASLSKSGVVTLKRLQSAMSPACAPLFTIRDILIRDLGYTVAVDPSNPTSVGAMIVS